MSNQRNKTNDAQKSTGQDAEQNDISGHETSQKTYPAALGATGAFMDEPDSSPVAPKPSSFRTKPDPRPKPKRPSSSSVQQRNGLSSGVPYKAVVPGTAEADKEIDPQSTRSTFAPSQDTLNPRTYQTLDLYSHDNQHSDNSSVNKSDNNQGQETIPKTVDTALKASTNTEDRRTDPKTATRNVNAAARSKPPSRRRTDDKEDGARSRDGRESDRPESVYTSVDSIYPGRRYMTEQGRRVMKNPARDVNVSTSMTDLQTLNVSINVSLNIAELVRSHQSSTNGDRNTANNTEYENVSGNRL
ncbi:hypothetical protein MAR_008131 [Mya arenaria]|uniref:Uncharacterized protein n=1 Tax=Mya arenaria TaxID=6604 RepID=A0ABY7DV16_MYAAR|nr:hypothetical protein MAR_008131 [Mya arenaria]